MRGQGRCGDLVDTHQDLAALPGLTPVIAPVRRVMDRAPSGKHNHASAIAALEAV